MWEENFGFFVVCARHLANQHPILPDEGSHILFLASFDDTIFQLGLWYDSELSIDDLVQSQALEQRHMCACMVTQFSSFIQ